MCVCGTTLSGLRRRTEKEIVAGRVCMCTGWWGVGGLSVDAYVVHVCVVRGLAMVLGVHE